MHLRRVILSWRGQPSHRADEVTARALQLLTKTDAGQRPVRLLGVSVHGFCDDSELIGRADLLPFETGSVAATTDHSGAK